MNFYQHAQTVTFCLAFSEVFSYHNKIWRKLAVVASKINQFKAKLTTGFNFFFYSFRTLSNRFTLHFSSAGNNNLNETGTTCEALSLGRYTTMKLYICQIDILV